MKIYLVRENDYVGYDDYDSIVVIAESEEKAIEIAKETCSNFGDNLSLTDLGISNEDQSVGYVLASYNAG